LNFTESISKTLYFSTKLTTVWPSKELKVVEGLQKLLFPEGIYYNKGNRKFRTPKVNSIFQRIAGPKLSSDENEKGTNHTSEDLSLLAGYQGQLSNVLVEDLNAIVGSISRLSMD
jgi:hypothetical protein